MVIPHILYQVSNAEQVIQFIATETGCSIATLLTSCLSLCMTLVLTSYAMQHHDRLGPLKDERSLGLYNMLKNHLSEEVEYFRL